MATTHNSDRSQASNRKIRVVSIAHPAFGDGSGRLRYEAFINDPQVQLTVVIPDRWIESGRQLKRGTRSTSVEFRSLKVALPAVPKANWYLHFYPAMAKMLDELRPQVLHLWEEPWGAVAAQAAYLCQRRGIALVLETDQNIVRALPFPFQQLRQYTLPRTDLLIARQQEALDVSRSWGYSGPAAFVEYVVDRDCFKPLDTALAKSTFNVEGFTIGYVGRLIREKGLFTVLDALTQCREKINFLMMGSGSASDELKQRIQILGLADRVRVLDSQPPEKVALFMNSLSALVLMSETTRTWKEQFGRVIVEAQACGVPVIGSSSGSIPSVTGEGGWIVEEANSRQLASLLDDLASHRGKVEQASVKAIENLQRFTPEIVAGSLRAAWLSAFESHAARRLKAEPPLSGSFSRAQ
jgi:glycosyltransferase involved in cell wall biosynthesis